MFLSPSGQGVTILRFLHLPDAVQRLKDGIEHIKIPTQQELQSIDRNNIPKSLSRDTGAGILQLVADATAEDPIQLVLQLDFVKDGLFCEYAYVLDLDKNVLEVYGGSIHDELSAGAGRLNEVEGVDVGIYQSFALTKLPEDEDEFDKACLRVLEESDEGKSSLVQTTTL